MKYFVEQLHDSDCGFTCLKIILALSFKRREYLYLTETTSCQSFLGIKEEALTYGVQFEGYKIIELTPSKSYSMCIAQTKMLEKMHFVIVKKVTRNGVLCIDPGCGECFYTHLQFSQLFTGNILKLMKLEKNMTRPKQDLLKSRFIYNHIFRAISFIILIMGLGLIQTTSSFETPLILILSYAICEIMLYKYTIRSMKIFDKHHLLNDKTNVVVSMLKKELFSSVGRNFNSFASIITIILICFINSIILGILCLSSVLCTLLIYALRKYLTQRICARSQLNSKTENYDAILKEGYKCANSINLAQSVLKFIIAINLLVIMEITKNVSLNYFIFYFGAMMILINSLDSMYELNNKKEQVNKLKAQYVALIKVQSSEDLQK